MLEAAGSELRRLGIDAYAELAQAWIAEAEAFGGDPFRALEIGSQELQANDRQRPLLTRMGGIALARLGAERRRHARAESLAADGAGAQRRVRHRRDDRCHGPRRTAPTPDLLRERDEILGRLKISPAAGPGALARAQRVRAARAAALTPEVSTCPSRGRPAAPPGSLTVAIYACPWSPSGVLRLDDARLGHWTSASGCTVGQQSRRIPGCRRAASRRGDHRAGCTGRSASNSYGAPKQTWKPSVDVSLTVHVIGLGVERPCRRAARRTRTSRRSPAAACSWRSRVGIGIAAGPVHRRADVDRLRQGRVRPGRTPTSTWRLPLAAGEGVRAGRYRPGTASHGVVLVERARRVVRQPGARRRQRVAVVGLVERQVVERGDAVDGVLGHRAAERRAGGVVAECDRHGRRGIDQIAARIDEVDGHGRSADVSFAVAGDRVADERVVRLGVELEPRRGDARDVGGEAAVCAVSRRRSSLNSPPVVGIGEPAVEEAVAARRRGRRDRHVQRRPRVATRRWSSTTMLKSTCTRPLAPVGSDASVTLKPSGGRSPPIRVPIPATTCSSVRRRTSSICRRARTPARC